MRQQKEPEVQFTLPLRELIVGGILLMSLTIPVSGWAQSQEVPFDTDVPAAGGDSGVTPPPAFSEPNTNTSGSGAPVPAVTPPPINDPFNNGTPPPESIAAPQALPKSRFHQAPAELAGLGNLAPFSDIAVITKRFLPKTHRFEFFPNLGLVLNDSFFNDLVLGGRLGFYFSENWGIEANGESISSSAKGVTSELQTYRNVQTQSLATPTSFYGLDVKWDPIYGKVGLLNKKIIPFDFFFLAGGGITATNQGTSPPTVHLGVGQLFAMSKWMAFRWDISWYAYNTVSQVSGSSGTFTNLHATVGLSFFFPSAEYR